MPRKRQPTATVAADAAAATTTATTTPPPDTGAATLTVVTPRPEHPAKRAEPQGDPAGSQEPLAAEPQGDAASGERRQWKSDPYRAIMSCPAKGFEMGEDRRFKQMVFRFTENPGKEVTDRLKEAGFRYRGEEKRWTIQADAASRELALRLAHELRGEERGQAR